MNTVYCISNQKNGTFTFRTMRRNACIVCQNIFVSCFLFFFLSFVSHFNSLVATWKKCQLTHKSDVCVFLSCSVFCVLRSFQYSTHFSCSIIYDVIICHSSIYNNLTVYWFDLFSTASISNRMIWPRQHRFFSSKNEHNRPNRHNTHNKNVLCVVLFSVFLNNNFRSERERKVSSKWNKRRKTTI